MPFLITFRFVLISPVAITFQQSLVINALNVALGKLVGFFENISNTFILGPRADELNMALHVLNSELFLLVKFESSDFFVWQQDFL